MNYIIFDLEATCEKNNKSFRNEIIEIGAVKINDEFEIVDEFSSFVKPKFYSSKLTDFCKELTSITQSDVDNADGFEIVIDRFLSWVGDEEHIFCSWGFYDKSQFKKDCDLHKMGTSWIRDHISLKHQHGEKIIKIEKGIGMERALNKAGLKLNGTHHRGIDDARNIAQIFLKYRDIWDFN